MSTSLKNGFKNFFKTKIKDQSSYKNKDLGHDQDVISILKLMPLAEFYDGIDKSAFFLNPNLLSGFLGTELGGVISDISNDFDFGFETN